MNTKKEVTAASPAKLGPYRLGKPLGRGGMGVVYRAFHEVSGEEVAVKTVRAANAETLQGIRREILALAAIHHPGIVKIREYAVDVEQPWYAMEHVAGETLASWAPVRDPLRSHAEEQSATSAETLRWCRGGGPPAGAARDAREPHAATPSAEPRPRCSRERLETVLRVVNRLCWTLAYLHGEGIVHRDLKPENVILRPDGIPVLVDFGLTAYFAAATGREALWSGPVAAGSAGYMAPEQIRGEFVDARADLYALGCMLYFLLAARPPFVAATAMEVLREHLGTVPPRLSELVDGIPPLLDSLACSLLAKRPPERIGHASDVIRQLSALVPADACTASWPQPRPYLYRPALSGRLDELAQMSRSVADARRGAGEVIAVFGERGVGKTRLVMEVVREAAAEGFAVFVGECRETPRVPLGGMLRPLQAIADRCRAGGIRETEQILGAAAKILAPYARALADLPGKEIWPDPPELPPAEARRRLFTALTSTFEALAAASPLLVVLEDVHWADDLTRDWVLKVADGRRVRAHRWIVVVTVRTEEAASELTAKLSRGRATVCRLGRLPETDAVRVVANMLGLASPPARFGAFIARHSSGNPFFIAEYLRTAVSGGLLRRDRRGVWQVASGEAAGEAIDFAALPLPASIEALIARRLGTLSRPARALSELAAVLGQEPESDLLQLLAEGEEIDFLSALDELIRMAILEVGSARCYCFTHDTIRLVAYASLDEELRRRLHERAARNLEARDRGPGDLGAAALARHWELAGDAARAARYHLLAAQQARRAYAHKDAERSYQSYFDCLAAPTVESVRARCELARDVLFVQGRPEDALAQLRHAHVEAVAVGDESVLHESLIQLSIFRWRTTRQSDAAEMLQALLPAVRARGAAAQELEILLVLSNVAAEMCRWSEAETLQGCALALAEKLGDHRMQAKLQLNRGTLCAWLGEYARSVDCFGRARALFAEHGDRRWEAVCVGNSGLSLLQLGDIDAARRSLEAALALARETGSADWEAVALCYLAEVCVARGSIAEAMGHYEVAAALSEKIQLAWSGGIALLGLARIARRCAGDMGAADRYLAAAEAKLPESQYPAEAGACHCERAFLELAAGHSGRDALGRAEDVARRLDAPPLTDIRLAIARVQRAQEAFDQGRGAELVFGEAAFPEQPPAAARDERARGD
ncbi:MAG: AAA family ATPase [Candidatus Schekmanbacteria bacterium]|nr:AAA family ATPase [Candidatus Schekmanbacteria bacterium]